MARVVVGISGASGIILAQRTVMWLTKLGHDVDLIATRAALHTASLEMDARTVEELLAPLSDETRGRVKIHRIGDFSAPIASGSCLFYGMIIIPCSMATLAAVATGLSDNLLRRVADVCLKERRKLVIVPRETPLSEIHLENMLKITRAGGVILPPEPAWYLRPESMQDVEDYVVGRALDSLGIESPFCPRWQGAAREGAMAENIPLPSA